MTIMILSITDYAIKRAVARRYGYNPYDTASWLTNAVVSKSRHYNSQSRSEADANRAMADFAVYRRTARRLDYRSI